jgi:4'-phosphopantetheinyl transferase
MIALWYINETPEMLQQLINIDEFVPFKNDRRNTHWLSARIALQEAIGKQTSKIIKNKEGKPFLEDEDGHISMSHSGEMSAAIFNTTNSCGIDLELYDERIKRIAYKFTTDVEAEMFPSNFFCSCACLLWSAKESVFKFGSIHEVDFKEQIQMTGIDFENQTMDFLFTRVNPVLQLKVYFRVYEAVDNEIIETPLLPDTEMALGERYILTWI